MMKRTRCHAFRFQVNNLLSNVLAIKPFRSRQRRRFNVLGGHVNVILKEIRLDAFTNKHMETLV